MTANEKRLYGSMNMGMMETVLPVTLQSHLLIRI